MVKVKRMFTGEGWDKYYEQKEKLAKEFKVFTEYQEQVGKAHSNTRNKMKGMFADTREALNCTRSETTKREDVVALIAWLKEQGYVEVFRNDRREADGMGYSDITFARFSVSHSRRKKYASAVKIYYTCNTRGQRWSIELHYRSRILKTWARDYNLQNMFDNLTWII